LLDGPQRADHGIEEEQQHQQTVLIKVELAVPRLVALAAHLVQARQQRRELVEVLQARNVLFAHVFALFACHTRLLSQRQENQVADAWRKSRAKTA
jgi:hypothetical protein